MQVRVFTAHLASRCVYCHDTLEAERMECACGAAYHVECGDACVTLGCKGTLERRTRTPRSRHARFAPLVAMVLAIIALSAGAAWAATKDASLTSSIALLTTFVTVPACICAIVMETTSAKRRVKPRKHNVVVEPAPTAPAGAVDPGPASALELPGFVIQRVVLDAPPSGDDVDARRKHLDGRRDAGRPPGLGRTI